MLRTRDLEFELPEELIARVPAEPRDASRLLVVSRSDPGLMEHRVFRDLPEYLKRGDVLVFNRSAVLPARLAGRRADTGGGVGGLYLGSGHDGTWTVMLRAGSKLREGLRIELVDARGEATGDALQLLSRAGMEWTVRVRAREGSPAAPETVLERAGATPLPPYILGARRHEGIEVGDDRDRAWYQTVYADRARAGSVAAPTAGLHFTPGLLERVDAMGVARTGVVLHVGAGTFKPVETEFVERHPMHSEWCEVSGETIAACVAARQRGGRVIPVGTTSVRALESLPHPLQGEAVRGVVQETRLLITPGFPWRWTDGLVTNFHLPHSTLLALVGALFEGGVPRLLEIYAKAIEARYRFFSYGDAMLVLP